MSIVTPDKFKKSVIVEKSKEEVKEEYTKTSQLQTDAQKAMWGSEESMHNRFCLILDTIEWSDIEMWLDIGCGSGRLFELAEERDLCFKKLIGVDITKAIISQARNRSWSNPVRFEVSDLETMPANIQDMDLITLVGVLQLCGVPLAVAVRNAVDRLSNGGQIFLTTKHLGWSAFDKVGFDPDPSHSWFLMEAVREAVENSGVEIINEGGFLPSEGKIIALGDAHTIFVHGRKNR